ncbi:hypothetical protein WI23_19080 [Burkholderia oklahomensis C6786]|nr:hypothetical protein [Burkholderia oklahomensis]AOI48013.1 hypothetical protein WI23_19080 [Burkholderia oklahomensis C6786]KUY50117.1 hypothetical protein WI23_02890 [Burkholderia oklahomensis C6786]MBI0363872.1 hypothetical protein [Burkholderia oklahomensis]
MTSCSVPVALRLPKRLLQAVDALVKSLHTTRDALVAACTKEIGLPELHVLRRERVLARLPDATWRICPLRLCRCPAMARQCRANLYASERKMMTPAMWGILIGMVLIFQFSLRGYRRRAVSKPDTDR